MRLLATAIVRIGLPSVLVALLSFGASGCRWFRNECRNPCIGVGVGEKRGWGMQCGSCSDASAGVAAKDVTIVPSDYRPASNVLTVLSQSVDRGIEGPAGGVCSPVCVDPPGDPESAACERCRIEVLASVQHTFLSICAGTGFQPLPDHILGVARATTDRGTFESQPMHAFKRSSTIWYHDCDSPNRADYDLDEGPSQQFSSYVATSTGSSALLSAEFVQMRDGGVEDRPLLELKPEIRQLVEEVRFADGGSEALRITVSGWPFVTGGGEPLMGPVPIDGAYLLNAITPTEAQLIHGDGGFVWGPGKAGFLPCSNDEHCPRGFLCRPSDDDGTLGCVIR